MSKYGEPWNLIDGWTYASGEPEPVMGYSETGGVNMTVPCDEYQSRIVACVNALAGIDDPARFVQRVRHILDSYAKDDPCAIGDQRHAETLRLLAMLPPKGTQ